MGNMTALTLGLLVEQMMKALDLFTHSVERTQAISVFVVYNY